VTISDVNNSTTSVQTFFTVSRTRTSVNDPASVSYSVAVNNGTNPNGVNNRASLGSATLRYDVFTNSASARPGRARACHALRHDPGFHLRLPGREATVHSAGA
jgi:spore coat protein U-like protein